MKDVFPLTNGSDVKHVFPKCHSMHMLPPTDPAKITKITNRQQVLVGATVTLECVATGTPLPDVTWKIEGQEYTVLQVRMPFATLRTGTNSRIVVLRNSRSVRWPF